MQAIAQASFLILQITTKFFVSDTL